LRWVLRKAREGIQYVEDTDGDGQNMFAAVCKLGLEGIVSKRSTSVYKSGPSKTWIKVKIRIRRHIRAQKTEHSDQSLKL
jgi:bifunctional non-homologous end joining protein LigD